MLILFSFLLFINSYVFAGSNYQTFSSEGRTSTFIINVNDFGAVGDGVHDDTNALNQAFISAKSKRNATIIFPYGKYKISNEIRINNLNTLFIKGNNSTIYITNPNNKLRLTALSLTFNDGESCTISNLHIDGKETPQELWDNRNWSEAPVFRAFDVFSNFINISNCNISNIWGYGISLYRCNNVFLNNIKINNVGGHWYTSNLYDAFGDAIFIGDRANEMNVEIDNVHATGKFRQNPDGTNNVSRVGITIENLHRKLKDSRNNLIIKNSSFINFDRVIHSEGNFGTLNIDIKNTTLKGRVIFLGYANKGLQSASINNCKISFWKGSFNGSFGLARHFTIEVANSHINNTGSGQAMGDSGTNGHYINSTFDNMDGTFATNSNLEIENCVINIKTTKRNFLFWETNSTFNNCVFNTVGVGFYKIPNIQRLPKFINCTFNDVYFDLPRENYRNAIVNFSSIPHGVNLNKLRNNEVTIYIKQK